MNSMTATDRRLRTVDPDTRPLLTTSASVWRYLVGFVVGVLVTLTLTILVGWLIDSATPHTSWLNRAFYGYLIGCSSVDKGSDLNG